MKYLKVVGCNVKSNSFETIKVFRFQILSFVIESVKIYVCSLCNNVQFLLFENGGIDELGWLYCKMSAPKINHNKWENKK